ncbi:hypothetical protein HPK19_19475 [Arthrobacter citreus]|nr:hypothetical protein HPK19_19475 [Arthrobacter citreus]
MTTLKHKFKEEELKDFCKTLNKIQYNATTWVVKNRANENEKELLDTIDHLCRACNMFSMVMIQHLEGNVETGDPESYIHTNLSISESSLKHYIKSNKLEFE